MTDPKRWVLTAAAVLLLLPAPAAAQVTLGVKGGVNFSELADLDDEIEASSKSDFVGGVYVNVGGRWSFQPEMLYSRRGADLGTAGVELGAVQQNFVEIPALVHFRLLEGLVEPALYGGVSASFESSCEIEEFGEDTSGCGGVLGAETNSTLWAGILGASLDLDLAVLILGLDARYNYGFTKILDDPEDDTKWRYFSLMAQVGLALGR